MSTTSISTSFRRRLPGLRRQTRGLLGFEISHSHLRFAREIAADGIMNWETGELPLPFEFYDGSKLAGKALRQQLAVCGVGPANATGILISPEIDAFPLTLSARATDGVEKLIVAQAGDHLSYPLQEAVLDYIDIPDSMRRPDDKSHAVLVYAVPSELTHRISDTFEYAGYPLDTIVTPACVLASHLRQIAPGQRHLLIAPLEEATVVAIIQDGNILMERFLAWNLGILIERLVRELELSPERCLTLLDGSSSSSAFDPDQGNEESPAPLRDILSPALHDLAQEAMGCVGYCNSLLQSKPVSEILLLGPLADQPFLRDSISQLLNLPLVDIAHLSTTPGGPRYLTAACAARLADVEREVAND